LQTLTRPSDATISFTHNGLGRETMRIASTGEQALHVWDEGGRRVQTIDDLGATRFTFDGRSSLVGIEYPTGGQIRFARDAVGRVSMVDVYVPNAGTPRQTSYGYDENGNVTSVVDPAGGTTSLEYDAANRLTRRMLPNGFETLYGYDLRDRLVSIVHRNDEEEVIAGEEYDLLPTGAPDLVTRADGSWVDFDYDPAMRLVRERYYNNGSQLVDEIEYTYDGAGNRSTRETSAGTATYGYDPGHKLRTVTGVSPTESYDFDEDGRVRHIERGPVDLELSFNAMEQLVAVETSSGTISYFYDGDGRRVEATLGANRRQFLVAPTAGAGLESVFAVSDGNGAEIMSFSYVGNRPLMRLDGGSPIYYLTDRLGSTMMEVDGSGNIVGSVSYDGFGNMRSVSGIAAAASASGGAFRFQGQWREDLTGLYHLRAREYDPVAGRFVSRDQMLGDLMQPETFNPYAFANANPQLFSDPLGYFGMVEVNLSMSVQDSLQGVQSAAQNALLQYLKDKGQEIVTDLLLQTIKSFLPAADLEAKLVAKYGHQTNTANNGAWGNAFGSLVGDLVCKSLPLGSYVQHVYLEPGLYGNGRPAGGFNCGAVPRIYGGTSRADFLISKFPLDTFTDQNGRRIPIGGGAWGVLNPGGQGTFLVAEAKWKIRNLRHQKPGQRRALIAHAHNYEYAPVVLFLVWNGGTPSQRVTATRDYVKAGVWPVVAFVTGS